ncbi:hypothetical protein [Campylobacter lanienae]|uniref:Uncharacterized protein n=1 Tax=Campylobacter lanienae TaxID=75658 RepID=A0ABY3G614_9BACT|nr:hypothetical protein [Campylobacter lanienae]TWO13999.1 hypothetical protein ZA02_05975 [Campylobacter lanienae]TWO27754.1 hypothetical protein XK09_06895 [Campylobacter lanienae]
MAAFFVFFLIFSILGILASPLAIYYVYNIFFGLEYESSETIKNADYNYGKFLKMKNKIVEITYYIVVFYTLVFIYSYIESLYLVFR